MSIDKGKYEESSEKNGEFDLPQHILEQYDSDQQVQLIKGYRTLQVLKYYPNNEPFFEKPENVVRGSKSYYDVIKSPMYLNEMKRKFFNAEYQSLLEVIKDMRLIFENCYYFWGPRSVITEQCLQMERLMEGQMLLLPKDLKNGCSLEETHGKNEDDVVTKIWNRCRNKGKTCSRLMLRTWRKRRMSETKEYSSQSDLSKFCKNSKQIMGWERDVLFLPDILSFISSALELPQIGLFFQLVQNEFDLTPVSQTEVERIVIMPQYSSSFREIFSALFCENRLKDSLTYDQITEKIQNYVTQWYELYDEYEKNVSKVSEDTGLQTNFFDFVGVDNPLLSEKYEQLPYCKKVIILKAVCDHLTHIQSSLRELLLSADESKYSPRKIGKDKYGYTYLFFPTFLDFRLYKQKIKNDKNSSKDNSRVESKDNADYRAASLKRFLPSASTDFEIVADSTEGIRYHIDELFYADLENTKKDSKGLNNDIIEALQELEWEIKSKETNYIRLTNETRVKLFNEWRENCENSEPVLEDETTYNNLQRDLQNEDEALEAAKIAEKKKRLECDRNEDGESEGRGSEAEDEHEDEDSGSKEEEEAEDYVKRSRITNVKTADQPADSIFKKMESVIKSEPTEIDENFSDYEIKTEVKDEIYSDSQSETSSISTRRRRSSVPSYSMFNDDYFSDDAKEYESPEDEFSSSSDSDDEWEIPGKRTRNHKAKVRNAKSSARKNEYIPPERPRRKCRNASSSNVAQQPPSRSEDECCEPSSSTHTADDVRIKEETADGDDDEAGGVDSASKRAPKRHAVAAAAASSAAPAAKPPPKLKVVDLARLKSSNEQCAAPTSALQRQLITAGGDNPADAFMLRAVPVMQTCVSQPLAAVGVANSLQQPTRIMLQPAQTAALVRGGRAYVVPQGVRNTFVMTSVRRPVTPLVSSAASGRGPPPILPATMAPANYANAGPRLQFVHGVAAAAPVANILPKQMQLQVPYGRNGGNLNHGMAAASTMRPLAIHNNNGSSSGGNNNNNNGARMMMMARKPHPILPYDGQRLQQQHARNAAYVTKPTMMPMMQRRPSVREIEGTIGIHADNNRMQFVVNLANGSHVPLTNEQVQKLRDGNRGVLPQKLKIPVPADVAQKIEPCVVVDEDMF